MNMILFQLYSLKKAQSLEYSLGTHCLENFFGNVRNLSKNYDSHENIITNVSHTQISNIFLCKIGFIKLFIIYLSK